MKNSINSNYPDLKVKGELSQSETEIWLHSLNCRMEGNLLMKERLSAILKDNFTHDLLEEIEKFQTSFIKEDELIQSLKKKIANLWDEQMTGAFENGRQANLSDSRAVQNLRKDIIDSTIEFYRLQAHFDSFHSKIVGCDDH